MKTRTLQGSWIWYELMSPDPAGSKAFYDAVVGWNIQTSHADDMDYGFITCPDGGMVGGVLRISDDMKAGGCVPAWIGYVGVDNVDTSLKAIEAAGGKILMPTKDVEMAGRIAMITDCCGAHFYIMTPTPPPGGGESTAFSAEPRHGRCGWNELMAGDPANAIGFYTGMFGWTLPEPMDMGEMGKYQFVAHDGVTTGAIMAKMPHEPQPHWNHYFWVPSIDKAAAAIPAHGGQISNGPMQVPGDDWIVQAIDPQGAHFALVGKK
jgi:uncharacterized protein